MTTGLRAVVAGILLVVGFVLVPFGNLGLWVQRQVLDADAFTELAIDVVDEPAVRDVLAKRIVDELVAAEPRLAVGRVVLEPGVARLLRTEAFRRVFSTAVAQMHTQLEQGADALELDLDPILPLVRDAVARIDADVADLIPTADALPAITVVRRDDAPELWEGVQLTREASWAFPALMVLALVGAVAAANRRVRMLVTVGIGVALLGFVQVLVIRLGRELLLDAAGPEVSLGALTRGYDVVTGTLVTQTIVGALVGLVVAGAAIGVVLVRRRDAAPADWA